MIGRELIEQRDVSLSEVKSVLKKREKDSELSYEQKAAYDYAKDEAKRGIRKTKQLIDELVKIEKIDEHMAVMIADNNPKDKEDLRLITEKQKRGTRHGLSENETKKVLDLVAEYSD